jgi:hypothetical protein
MYLVECQHKNGKKWAIEKTLKDVLSFHKVLLKKSPENVVLPIPPHSSLCALMWQCNKVDRVYEGRVKNYLSKLLEIEDQIVIKELDLFVGEEASSKFQFLETS